MFETELPDLPEMLSSLIQGLLQCSKLKPDLQPWMPLATVKNAPFQSIQGFKLTNVLLEQHKCTGNVTIKEKCRSPRSVVVLLIGLAGNSLLSERRGCAKYLIGKATAAPPEGAVFLAPISTSELRDGNQEGVHGNRDVCCRVGGEPALIRSKVNLLLSTPTS